MARGTGGIMADEGGEGGETPHRAVYMQEEQGGS